MSLVRFRLWAPLQLICACALKLGVRGIAQMIMVIGMAMSTEAEFSDAPLVGAMLGSKESAPRR
ncbi:hypothetical protein [Albidovulum aquaemixtae]|uniref:hypothetical protein n=1 Tax=Albidovulum aquaemixtae TaxID=1542388 RepID=UPI000D55E0AD|nr:hypothetical protein [Defluviimonas aquaemixtae]